MRALFAPWARARARRIALAVTANLVSLGFVGAVIFSIAFAAPPGASPSPILTALMFVGFLGAYIGPAVFHLLFAFAPRPKAREVDVEVLGGAVRVPETGHTIRAKDVLGATTTVHDGRYLLHVEERYATGPHAFAVDSVADLDALRAALGVGHDGDGAVEWPLTRDKSWIFAVVGAASTFMCSGMTLPLLMAWPALRAKPRVARSADLIAMTPAGVRLSGRQRAEIPYAAITGVSVLDGPRALQLKGAGDALLAHVLCSTMGRDDLLRLAAQIEGAARRARGEHAPRASAVDRLGAIRRAGQTAGEWLARLDASGHLVAQDGYRASPIDVEDLWRVAEDPAESFEDRLAAGRFLLRVQGEAARVRIDDSLGNVRVDPKRLRIALEAAPEEAAVAFTEAEAEVQKVQRLRR